MKHKLWIEVINKKVKEVTVDNLRGDIRRDWELEELGKLQSSGTEQTKKPRCGDIKENKIAFSGLISIHEA
jgi:hypothetical protein